MLSRRHWSLAALAAASALVIAACGGGGSDEKLDVGKVVSFGDSYSDLGTYAVVASIAGTGAPPFFGGRWTTNTFTGYTAASNSNTATIWVEWVAARVGYPISQAVLGFATTVIPCPAAGSIPSLASSCTAYGQGGSLITDPNGIGHAGGAGALTFPVSTQVANHLARFTSFAANDLVFVFAGGNELLVNFTAVSQGLPPATALANIQTAGSQLAAIVKDQIVAKGARRVAVTTLPDIAPFPAFNQLPAANTAILGQLATAFNTGLTTGLAGVDVRYIDGQALFQGLIKGGGFANVTAGACDPAKIAVITGNRITDGSSLACNASAGQPFNGMKATASASTWLFADGVHPSTGGHKAIGDYVIAKIKEWGWIPSNL